MKKRLFKILGDSALISACVFALTVIAYTCGYAMGKFITLFACLG